MSAVTELTDFLESVQTFAEFGAEELRTLEQALSVDSYPNGYLFMGEKTRASEMFLIIQGEVVATHRHAHPRGNRSHRTPGSGAIYSGW